MRVWRRSVGTQRPAEAPWPWDKRPSTESGAPQGRRDSSPGRSALGQDHKAQQALQGRRKNGTDPYAPADPRGLRHETFPAPLRGFWCCVWVSIPRADRPGLLSDAPAGLGPSSVPEPRAGGSGLLSDAPSGRQDHKMRISAPSGIRSILSARPRVGAKRHRGLRGARHRSGLALFGWNAALGPARPARGSS